MGTMGIDDQTTLAGPPPRLVALPAVQGTQALPGGYAEGRALFAAGMDASEESRDLEAAELFFEAAEKLRVGIDDPYFKGLLPVREAAYRNAWACWIAAGYEDAGRQKLKEAMQQDLRLGQFLDGLLAR